MGPADATSSCASQGSVDTEQDLAKALETTETDLASVQGLSGTMARRQLREMVWMQRMNPLR